MALSVHVKGRRGGRSGIEGSGVLAESLGGYALRPSSTRLYTARTQPGRGPPLCAIAPRTPPHTHTAAGWWAGKTVTPHKKRLRHLRRTDRTNKHKTLIWCVITRHHHADRVRRLGKSRAPPGTRTRGGVTMLPRVLGIATPQNDALNSLATPSHPLLRTGSRRFSAPILYSSSRVDAPHGALQVPRSPRASERHGNRHGYEKCGEPGAEHPIPAVGFARRCLWFSRATHPHVTAGAVPCPSPAPPPTRFARRRKLYDLIDSEPDRLICWSAHGASFMIVDQVTERRVPRKWFSG